MADDFEANLLRDLCAISNFGDIEGMLEDLEFHRKSKDQQRPTMQQRKPRHSRLKHRGNPIIVPDYSPPSGGMGRGAALQHFYEFGDELRLDLEQIEAGAFRNESIEAFLSSSREENECCAGTSQDVATEPPLSAEIAVASPEQPVELPAPKAAKPKKKTRNAVLLSYQANKLLESKADTGGAAAAAAAEPAAAAAEPAARGGSVDEDAGSSDAYVVPDDQIGFGDLADSFASSGVEVESQESYSVDDGVTSEELQASVGALTEVSACSTPSKSSGHSQKCSSGSSERSNSSRKATSRRRLLPLSLSPLPVQNPAVGRRRSPHSIETYVPNIVQRKFTLNRNDFPAL